MKKNNKKKKINININNKYIRISIIILLISLVSLVGTYAWFTWNSTNNTRLTLSIGDLADVVFTSGNDIEVSNLSPVYNYTDGEYTTFTIENRDDVNNLLYTVKLEIINIASELRNESFKYTLVQDNKVVKEGNMSLTSNNMTLNLNTSSLTKASSSTSPSTSTFKLYFWIDGNMENNSNMMNKSLTGRINVDIASNVLIESGYVSSNTSTFLGSEIQRQNISSVSFIDNINVPEGLTTVDVSLNQDNSILMWYTDEDNDGKYDMVIGSNDTIYASSGYYLFSYLTNATSIDLSNFDTSNVANMSYMFYNCSSLTSLDVTNFDTSKVTNMECMFSSCSSLTSLDVSNFDTSKVTRMDGMFHHCRSLTSLDLSNFDTSNVTTTGGNYIDTGMFSDCNKLTTIDLRNADFSSVTSYGNMFYNVPTSATIYLKDTEGNRTFMSNFSTYTPTYIA